MPKRTVFDELHKSFSIEAQGKKKSNSGVIRSVGLNAVFSISKFSSLT